MAKIIQRESLKTSKSDIYSWEKVDNSYGHWDVWKSSGKKTIEPATLRHFFLKICFSSLFQEIV